MGISSVLKKTLYNGRTLEDWYDRAVLAGYKSTKEEWFAVRRRAQTDLFWLATELLGYDLVDNFYCPEHLTWSHEVGDCPQCGQEFQPYLGGLVAHKSPHREMCELFIHKNPDISIAGQSTVKKRLLLASRGSFKSSIDEADCVQWIIAFPDVAILLATAEETLAAAFVDQVKKPFTVKEDPQGNKIHTPFHLLFPEHLVRAKERFEAGEWTTPARTNEYKGKEPSIFALSLRKNTSGWHFDVGKNDDCVSNANSGPSANADSRDKVRQLIKLADSLVNPYGYIHDIGTPYDEADAHSYRIEHTIPAHISILKRACWELKPESKAKKEDELGEADYALLFPFDRKGTPRLTYEFLHGEKHSDIHIFNCQYLVDPTALKVAKFTESLIRSHITQAEGLPQIYECVTQWDLAYSVEDKRDFSVGGVGWIDASSARLFVVNLIRGRFGKAELAFQIANQACKWKASKIAIENSGGAEFLENDIRRELIKLNYADCPIEWVKVDTNKNAKNSRAEGVETLLFQDRLYFSSEIDIMDDVVREFTRFKPHSKRKDDIVDTVGHLARFLPATPEVPQSEQQRRQKLWDILAQKDEHERIFNVPEAIAVVPTPMSEFEGSPICCMGCAMPVAYCLCK